jgi:glycosyltransferase involved in cell wall biosynthesis
MLDNEYPPLGGGTGVVNQRVLVEWMRCEDVEVDLVTSSRTRGQYEHEEMAPHIRIHKVPVDNRNIHHSTNRELLTYAWRGWRRARGLVKASGYDVCLAWAGVPAGGMAIWLKWEFGLPYVVSLQGPDVPGFEQRYRAIHILLRPFLRLIWRQAAALTACSEQHKELALQTEPDLPIQPISNGVDTQMFHPDPALRRVDGVIRLVCSGRLIERKGQQFLIPAVAELHRRGHLVELVIVGTGDNEPALRGQTSELGIEDIVHFTGFVEWQKMPQLYQSSDVFVLPSFNEGMSIALLEAMATGLPVVVTDTGGARELVDRNGIVVSWGSVDELTDALADLVVSVTKRQSMGQQSREIASRHTWERVAATYRELCHDAIM